MILYSLAFLFFFFCPTLSPVSMYYKAGLCALFLIRITPRLEFKLERLHLLFFAFLGWVAIGTYCSDYSYLSLVGFHLRVEGLVSWIVMTALAYYYWRLFKNYKPMIGFCIAVLGITFLLDLTLPSEQFQLIAFTPVAIGSICAVVAVMIWAVHPLLTLNIIPFLILGNCRSAIIAALTSITTYSFLRLKAFGNQGSFKRVLLSVGCIMVVVACIAFLSPIRAKISTLNIDSLGFGARSQWILQADRLDTGLPLTGYGIDTLSRYLKPVTDTRYGETQAVADKCHNLFFDVILTTGWIGYALFLAMISLVIWTVLKYKSEQNILCASILIGWFVFGMMNPTGSYASMLAIWALLGLKEKE